MKNATVILIGAALAAGLIARAQSKIKGSWFPHLTGWQKLFGVMAVILTLLIVLNPELLGLGLLGDSAFFDLFVLGLSLQMSALVARIFRTGLGGLFRSARWLGIPSLGLRYLLLAWTPVITGAVAAFQKAAHRVAFCA